MQQLKMLKLMGEVKPYPVHEDYYIRNIRMLEDGREDPAEIEAWVLACRNQLIGENGTSEAYTNSITNTPLLNPATDVFFVCEKATDRPVATLTAHIRDTGEGWIHMVGSLPEIRGKKLGHAMLARGLERLAEAGVPVVRLVTDDWRRPAIKNYLAAGFRPVIFEDTSEDAKPIEERWDVILDEMGWEDRTYLTYDGEIWTK
ncbi:MAG: GNAT family N-acetyltransferase [Clostridia bacterium]|nr:GNAT family N-acetyltransferase [Clostridia bacterium]